MSNYLSLQGSRVRSFAKKAISGYVNGPNLWNLNSYNAQPSSDQFKTCSDILSCSLSGSSSVFPKFLPVRAIYNCSPFQTQFSSLQSFNCKLRAQSLFRNCHTGKIHAFMIHNSARFHWTSSFLDPCFWTEK